MWRVLIKHNLLIQTHTADDLLKNASSKHITDVSSLSPDDFSVRNLHKENQDICHWLEKYGNLSDNSNTQVWAHPNSKHKAEEVESKDQQPTQRTVTHNYILLYFTLTCINTQYC